MPRKKRERCTLCGTPLGEREYVTDPEASLTCPGCGADLPCVAMGIPVLTRMRIKKVYKKL